MIASISVPFLGKCISFKCCLNQFLSMWRQGKGMRPWKEIIYSAISLAQTRTSGFIDFRRKNQYMKFSTEKKKWYLKPWRKFTCYYNPARNYITLFLTSYLSCQNRTESNSNSFIIDVGSLKWKMLDSDGRRLGVCQFSPQQTVSPSPFISTDPYISKLAEEIW